MGYPNPDRSIPIVRLTLESMQHSILHAFSEHQLQMDEMLQAAVKDFCKPENVRAVIDLQVKASIEDAIKSEIDSFYRYGGGRAAVKAAVVKKLSAEPKDWE